MFYHLISFIYSPFNKENSHELHKGTNRHSNINCYNHSYTKNNADMLKALGLEEWKAKKLANSRKGYWRMAQVLNSVIKNKTIAKLGYTSMLGY